MYNDDTPITSNNKRQEWIKSFDAQKPKLANHANLKEDFTWIYPTTSINGWRYRNKNTIDSKLS